MLGLDIENLCLSTYLRKDAVYPVGADSAVLATYDTRELP
jgi:hypothetical protein